MNVWCLAALACLVLAGVAEALYRRRSRVESYQVGECTQCGAVVRLGDGFRVLAHNPPGFAEHLTCMGSYLLPVTGSIQEVRG